MLLLSDGKNLGNKFSKFSIIPDSLLMSIVLSFEKPLRRVILGCAGEISEVFFLCKSAAPKVDQGRLKRGWDDEDIFEFHVPVKDCARLTVLKTFDDLNQNFSKIF